MILLGPGVIAATTENRKKSERLFCIHGLSTPLKIRNYSRYTKANDLSGY
jgi:hypothetical protein